MCVLFNDATENSLRWIYRSAQNVLTNKKPIQVYSSALLTKSGGRNNKICPALKLTWRQVRVDNIDSQILETYNFW